MADANKQRLGLLHQRLAASRKQLVELSHVLKGDVPTSGDAADAAEAHAGFPRSRAMRALLGRPGRVLIAGISVALPLLQPLLRPLLLRHVLPRLLGERWG